MHISLHKRNNRKLLLHKDPRQKDYISSICFELNYRNLNEKMPFVDSIKTLYEGRLQVSVFPHYFVPPCSSDLLGFHPCK